MALRNVRGHDHGQCYLVSAWLTYGHSLPYQRSSDSGLLSVVLLGYQPADGSDHSYFKAFIGSTALALWAGTQLASNVTAPSTAAMAVNVSTSK